MGYLINNIVITGATGYLGSRLVKRLLENGYKIHVVKRPSSIINEISSLSDNIFFYDSNPESLDTLFKKNDIDLVIHTATLYGRKGETISQIKEANLDFPFSILERAIDAEVPYFINTGTSLPYLTNQYSLFKHQFAECLEFFSKRIVSINILLEHFYGPNDDESKFISNMINKMRRNVPEIPLTLGTQSRDFIYIDDVLDAYILIINKISRFKFFNNVPLGTGKAETIRSVVETIKEISNSISHLNFGAIDMRDNELLKSDADISVLKQLNWYPKYSLREGLNIIISDSKKDETQGKN